MMLRRLVGWVCGGGPREGACVCVPWLVVSPALPRKPGDAESGQLAVRVREECGPEIVSGLLEPYRIWDEESPPRRNAEFIVEVPP